MVWLLLIAYWIGGLIVASFFYARWNRGVGLQTQRVSILASADLWHDQLAERITGKRAFEGDRIRIERAMVPEAGPRGPARAWGKIGEYPLSIGAGLVPKEGLSEPTVLGPLRRGPVMVSDWVMELGDPLGLFRTRTTFKGRELTLVVPRFASLQDRVEVRELEAAVTAPRAGSGTEVFGVREYRAGDALRRIHWRSSARRGELIVREFEPPGVQSLGIFCDPNPPSPEAADQVARLAASEAWDCLRAGGRVTLWAPGCEPSRPDEDCNFVALLEWLARYPVRSKLSEPYAPRVSDAVVIATATEPRLFDSVETVRSHGGSVRGWVVGNAELGVDFPLQRAGLGWPL